MRGNSRGLATVSILLMATIRGRSSRRSSGRRTRSSGAGGRGSTSHTTTSASERALRAADTRPALSAPLGSSTPGVSRNRNWACGQVDDAQEAAPGGLGLGRGDGQLLPHQPVQQGGLAHVGKAHEGDVAAFEIIKHFIIIAAMRAFFSHPFPQKKLDGGEVPAPAPVTPGPRRLAGPWPPPWC